MAAQTDFFCFLLPPESYLVEQNKETMTHAPRKHTQQKHKKIIQKAPKEGAIRC